MSRHHAPAASALLAMTLAVAGCSSSGGGRPAAPSFTPGPGTFRVTPHVPGNGAPPQPQLLTAGSARVLVAFGGAFEQDHHAVAGMSLQLAPSGSVRVAGRYPAGAVITLGAVRVRVLAVHDRSGESHDLVDLRITSG